MPAKEFLVRLESTQHVLGGLGPVAPEPEATIADQLSESPSFVPNVIPRRELAERGGIDSDRIHADPNRAILPSHGTASGFHVRAGQETARGQEALGPASGLKSKEVGAEEAHQELVSHPRRDESQIVGAGEGGVMEMGDAHVGSQVPQGSRNQREVIVLNQDVGWAVSCL